MLYNTIMNVRNSDGLRQAGWRELHWPSLNKTRGVHPVYDSEHLYVIA
jgi:hypothetical protein